MKKDINCIGKKSNELMRNIIVFFCYQLLNQVILLFEIRIT